MKAEMEINFVAALILMLFLLLVAAFIVLGISRQAGNSTDTLDPSDAFGIFGDLFPPQLTVSNIEIFWTGKEIMLSFIVDSPSSSTVDTYIEVASIPSGSVAKKKERELLQKGQNEFSYSITETGTRPYYIIVRIYTKTGKFIVSRGKYIEPDSSIPPRMTTTTIDCTGRSNLQNGCPCFYNSQCSSNICFGSDGVSPGICVEEGYAEGE